MAITIQSILDGAREDTNARKESGSDANARWKDAAPEGITWVNDFVRIAYAVRPDLRFGSGWGVVTELLVADNFPLPDRYRAACQAYVVARYEARDDEAVVNERFAAHLKISSDLLANT